MKNNNHITDLDAIELSSGWNYNDKITLSDEIHVNGNKYKVIKDQKPTNTGLGYKLYERYDNDRSTGKLIISFDGTDFSDLNDVNTDLRLAGDSIPNQLLEAGKVYTDLKNKYNDANTMSLLIITKENQSRMQGEFTLWSHSPIFRYIGSRS